MNSLDTIPLDKIDVGEGFNPRANVEIGDEFLASVKTHGIITPILVHPQGSGVHTRYFLVAGERRYRAAQAAKLTEIPAVIRTEFPTGAALPAALVENMQREQLTPIEEARAFKRAHDEGLTGQQLADAVGVSLDTIRQRIRLLDLPEKVQQHVDAGVVTLKTAVELQKLAPFGEAIVAKTADLLVAGQTESFGYGDEPILPADITGNPQWVIENAVAELGDEAPFLVDVRKGHPINLSGGYGALEWPEGVAAGPLVEKLKQLPEYDRESYKPVRGAAVEIKQEDIDAARAYGCLLELGDNLYINDPAWLLDLLDGKVDKAIASWQRKQKSAAKKNGAAASTDPAEAEKERKRQERAEQHGAQLSARERNISLRNALMELHAPELTLDAIRAVGELLFEYAGTDLGHAYRFVDERCETVKTKKGGEISPLTYSRDANGHLVEAFRAAETPQRALGILLKALVAARFVDNNAARQSDLHAHPRHERLRARQPGVHRRGRGDRRTDPPARHQARAEGTPRTRGGRACCRGPRDPGAARRGRIPWRPLPGLRRSRRKRRPCTCTVDEILAALEACPRCGEEDCHATCTGFAEPAEEVAAA